MSVCDVVVVGIVGVCVGDDGVCGWKCVCDDGDGCVSDDDGMKVIVV